MTNDELAIVYTTTHPADAEMVRLALEEEGLAAFIDGAKQGGLTGVLDVHVRVAQHDVEQAQRLIEEMRRPTVSDEAWDEALGEVGEEEDS
jgi:hypothetical protein